MPLLKVNQIASYSGNTLTVGTTGDTVTLAILVLQYRALVLMELFGLQTL
jgi:hypothetical protein